MFVIETERLGKRFGTFVALQDIDMQVSSGDFFGCFGPNGAGKTTLLRLLTGQTAPSSGMARVFELDVARNPIAVKEKVGIVPEVEAPPSYLTSYEYLHFVGKIRKVRNLHERISRWLDFFELNEAETTLCRDLSRGMRQKLMLASAFIHSPKLLFLDEPFVNLDPIFQLRVREYLSDYVKEGGTVFMCSHLLEIAERLCNRICILHKGRIKLCGELDMLKKREGKGLEQLFLSLVNE